MVSKNCFKIIALMMCLSNLILAQDNIDISSSDNIKLSALAEIGYLGVISHKIQFGNSGTYFDYKKAGGQDVLFAVSRFSLELKFKERNTLVFLYQPLRLESQVLLQEDLVVDDLIFPASSGVRLLYNFPFYRLSYMKELVKKKRNYSFAIGGSLQIRNATISFESNDGTLFRTNRDVGPVPALKIRTRKDLGERFFLEFEADGIYAPVSYLNGSDTEIVGAILDASIRAGIEFNNSVTSFFNMRYLGGGAVGTSEADGPGDGYVRNWLNFFTVTAGFKYDL